MDGAPRDAEQRRRAPLRASGTNLAEGSVLLSSRIDLDGLAQLRAAIAHEVRPLLSPERVADFVLAVNEVATNAIEYGGGTGWLVISADDRELLCEVSDLGPGVADVIADRARPSPSRHGGYGLWLARQLCTEITLSSSPAGTDVTLRMSL